MKGGVTLGDSSAAAPVARWLPFLRETLAEKKHFRWRMEGTSMVPTLPPGCELEIAPLLTPPAVGELLVFVVEDALVVHRLVRRWRGLLILQGDGRTTPDKPVAPDVVVGRVVAATYNGQPCWPQPYARPIAIVWVIRYHTFRLRRWWERVLHGLK